MANSKVASSLAAADAKHGQQVEKYVKVVNGLYDRAVADLSAMAIQIGIPEDGSTFSFPPGKQKAVMSVIQKMSSRIQAVIEAGDSMAWNEACSKNDEFIDAVLKTSSLSRKELATYRARNLEALAAFQQRKVEGMNLSERVWKTVQPFQAEIELAIDTATGVGKNAAALSRDVRSCLQEPSKLFRRVRDKYGNLHLSKAAQLYHPGQGVYRSSYKNAMRMTRTEINMAYRQSDHLRWQQLDFVVGMKIGLSNNHTCRGRDGKPHPFMDICDELAGKYPKDFKFVGWHPQCRCVATPILKTLDEVDKDVDEEGNYRSLPSANDVKEAPPAFNDYIVGNADRIAKWKSKPYYIKDNPQFVDKALHPEKYVVKALQLDAATQQLLTDFEMYGFNHQGSKKFNAALDAAKEAKLRGDQKAFDEAMGIMDFTKKTNDRITALRERKAAEPVLTREQKIQQAAQKRHAARTEAKEKELLAFARKHAEQTQQAYAEIDKVIARGSDYVDIDTAPLVDIRTAKTGVEVNGKTIGLSLEKQRKAAQELNAKVDTLIDSTKQYTDLIPDAADFLKKYSINEIDQAHMAMKGIEDYAKKNPLQSTERVLENLISNGNDGLYTTLYKRRLAIVKEDIKIETITNDLKALNITKTSIDPLQNLQQGIDAALAKRDIAAADALLAQAKAMSPVATGYENLVKTGYHSGKFDSAMQKCLDELGKGDIKAAQDALNEAATIKATNEANVARRKAREAAQKAAQAQQPAKPKKSLADAKNIDDIREILGDETPILLQNYEKSVQRDQYTNIRWKNNHENIETSLKEFFDDSLFSHCTNAPLDSLLERGILTNLQKGKLFGGADPSYDNYRRAYGHFAYGLRHDHDMSNVPKAQHLRDGDYYRCGVPVPKDLTKAYKEYASGYGNTQIILRKDRVVTTFTYDNSLGEKTIPSLTCDPKVCSIDGKSFSVLKNGKIDRKAIKSDTISGYIEIQYLPKYDPNKDGRIMPRDIESITLNKHPLKINSDKKLWEKWNKEGVDIYYWDEKSGKVVLYSKGKPLETDAERKKRILEEAKKRHAKRDAELAKKGVTKEEKIQALQKERAEAQAMAKEDVQIFLSNKEDYLSADITEADFRKIEDKLAAGNYLGAKKTAEDLATKAELLDIRLDSMANIPDARKWNKQFTVDEIAEANYAIGKKLKWLETNYVGKDDPDRLIAKLAKEADLVEHPEKLQQGAKRHKTWEIAKDAYLRKRDEVIYKYRKDLIDEDISELEAFKTADKTFKKYVTELKALAKEGRWGAVEEAITKAKDRRITIENEGAGKKAMKVGESSANKFSQDAFSQSAKDAAKWFKAKGRTAAAMRKAYKEADDYMSQYAEAMWSKLTQEEKHVLWLYTDGSSYINEEMIGTYCLRLKSWIDGSFRNGLADANVLTSIIEKAPVLKEGVWMQSGKSESAFKAIFGKDISRVDLQDLVGTEGKSNLFMSCHAARDGAFTKGTSTTGGANNVILSVYLPKGTKGAYVEPIASFGDSKRGADGLKWDGKKRKDEPSDQVEFILQRGSHFRITKAEYDKKTGKWYVDIELTEQEACKALKTTGIDFAQRPTRYKAPAS